MDANPRIPRRALRCGLALPEIGMGAAPVGNLRHPVTDADARAALDAALAAGLTYIDTAPFYGFGLSERRVGDAVRGTSAVVSTKVGRLLQPDARVRSDAERHGFRSPMPFAPAFDYTRDGVLRSWEASRHRLGLARIHILFVHDIGERTHGPDAARHWRDLTDGGGLDALAALRAAGEIAAFGVGVNEWEACLAAADAAPIDLVLLAGRYTLLDQSALPALDALRARGIAVVIGGPYNSGVLAPGGPATFDYAPAPPAVLARAARLRVVADAHGVPLAAAALRFPLAHPAVVSVVPGLMSAAHVRETVALHAHPIPAAFWADLRAANLLPEEAPTP